jgi:sulfur-carrier protein
MAIRVHIPAPLRQHTDNLSVVETTGDSVKSVLAALATQYPAFAERILDGGKVRQFVNVFVNDEDIRYLDSVDTAVKSGDEIAIIPAVAGGSR